MKFRAQGWLAGLASVFLVGCGGGGGSGDDDTTVDGSVSTTDGGGNQPDAYVMPPNSKMVRLIEAQYSIPAGQEFYQCTRVDATEQLDILKLIPVAPNGTHHTVFATDPSKGTVGTSRNDCGAIGLDWKPLFASGVGSPALTMPPGVSLRIASGNQMVLNLHLYNASGATITGTAALDAVVSTDPSALEPAGVPFVGPPPAGQFRIPSNVMMTDRCKVSRDTQFFAVFPHMHQKGRHIKIWAETGGGQQVVWDKDYDFNDQSFGSFTPIQLTAGDTIHVACEWDPSAANVALGDSSDQEMCFAISYVYPPVATQGPFCTCSIPGLGC